MLEVRNLDVQSDGDACIDVKAQRYRCIDVKIFIVRRCLVHVCQYLVCAVWTCLWRVLFCECRGVLSAVESEHVCGEFCGVSAVEL